jgi:hypothetical protein
MGSKIARNEARGRDAYVESRPINCDEGIGLCAALTEGSFDASERFGKLVITVDGLEAFENRMATA